MIVTIDGPAGVGKSSVAQRLAERLGFRFLDTGAMYRAVTLAALQRQLDLKDEVVIGQLPCQISLQLEEGRTLLDGVDVSKEIRTPVITSQTRFVANNSAARATLGSPAAAISRGPRHGHRGTRPGDRGLSERRMQVLSHRLR